MFRTFLEAAVLGISIAAPVGPIGILCIRCTLANGRTTGLACGLGAATADAVYGLLGALGIGVALAAAGGAMGVFRFVGAAWLAWLGVKTFRSRPAEREADADASGLWRAWASTFGLTLTNPLTILSFAAMFSAFASGGLADAPVLAAGVFVGSAAWWLFLSASVDRLRSRVGPRELAWVNRGSGVLLVAFALVAILR